MSNKKLGNDFESEFCKLLSEHGFWVHNMANRKNGQPADVIAARNGFAYLLDCKVCSNDKFDLRRIEDNQHLAMRKWFKCGNRCGLFALKMSNGDIYIADYKSIKKEAREWSTQVLSKNCIERISIIFSEFVEVES